MYNTEPLLQIEKQCPSSAGSVWGQTPAPVDIICHCSVTCPNMFFLQRPHSSDQIHMTTYNYYSKAAHPHLPLLLSLPNLLHVGTLPALTTFPYPQNPLFFIPFIYFYIFPPWSPQNYHSPRESLLIIQLQKYLNENHELDLIVSFFPVFDKKSPCCVMLGLK